MAPMSGTMKEGRMYPGQWVLGNVGKSSGRAGMAKAWSKMRLFCQSRNGSQLGVRSTVKGIRLSVMAVEECCCSGELLAADEEPFGLSKNVFPTCCLPLS